MHVADDDARTDDDACDGVCLRPHARSTTSASASNGDCVPQRVVVRAHVADTAGANTQALVRVRVALPSVAANDAWLECTLRPRNTGTTAVCTSPKLLSGVGSLDDLEHAVRRVYGEPSALQLTVDNASVDNDAVVFSWIKVSNLAGRELIFVDDFTTSSDAPAAPPATCDAASSGAALLTLGDAAAVSVCQTACVDAFNATASAASVRAAQCASY